MSAAPGPLAGCRVLVTRPRADAAGLVACLRQQGAWVLVAPCIRVRALALGPARLGRIAAAWRRASLVALTSRHAVTALCAALAQLGAGWPRRRAVLAVGPSTAQALWARRRRRAWVARPATAAGMLAWARRRLGPAARRGLAFLPQGQWARPELAEGLVALGLEVVAEPLYTTLAVARPLPAAAAGSDVVVFASPSAWQGFRARSGGALGARTHTVACGPTTAAAMAADGCPPDVVGPGARPAELARAVAVAWRRLAAGGRGRRAAAAGGRSG